MLFSILLLVALFVYVFLGKAAFKLTENQKERGGKGRRKEFLKNFAINKKNHNTCPKTGVVEKRRVVMKPKLILE